MKMSRGVFMGMAMTAAAALASAAETPRTFTLSTKSEAAREQLRDVQKRIESFQGGAPTAAMVRKILELDPDFAMAVYYLSVTAPGVYREIQEVLALPRGGRFL